MFESLKNKLKNWTEKIKEEVFGKENEEAKKIEEKKETQKKRTKKSKKKQKKFEKKDNAKETLVEDIKKEEGKTEKKEGFFARIFRLGEKEEQKQEEKVILEKEEVLKEKKVEEGFFSKIFKKELNEEKFDELFQELELTLLENNVAYEVVEKIKEELKKNLVGKKNYEFKEELRKIIKDILVEPENFLERIKNSLKERKPFVILFVGINGTGKTTSLAKIAHLLLKNKLSVCFAAADTYRAASIEQLEEHAKKLNIPLIKKDYGTDPASVGFEAIQYAKKHNIDVVLIDSAGRLNNKESLMNELEKIARVNNPDMKIFVGESITGNDSVEQAKSFDEKIGLTGSILSKADVDEKGGTILSIGYVTKKPILFLGVGQNYDDLEEFNKEKVLERLDL
ncbi:MAG: signal recognition particle-docking protein FtsY [Candidatus Pacearchaeota archaeon]